jgi:spermidine synthase
MNSFITPKVLEEIDSPINGKLKVVRSLGLGTYIQAGGLTQSGGVVGSIWAKTFRVIRKKGKFNNCLIMGLGGGTVALLVNRYFPLAKITGVDLDPLMVSLGKKYLGLDEIKVRTIIGDGLKFINSDKYKRYDLIIMDTYQGDDYPEKFESEIFLKKLIKILSPQGLIVFNRLYYDRKRPLAVKFLERLNKVFGKVETFFPEANVMFLCFKK